MTKLVIECNTFLKGTNLHMETILKTEPELDKIRPTIFTKVIELEESKIKETLVKLGWTPPKRK